MTLNGLTCSLLYFLALKEAGAGVYRFYQEKAIQTIVSNALNLVYLGILVFYGHLFLGMVHVFSWFALVVGLSVGAQAV